MKLYYAPGTCALSPHIVALRALMARIGSCPHFRAAMEAEGMNVAA